MSRTYITESEAEELFDEMLDDCYPELFGLLPSRILKECDPIQYNCAFTDWLDSSDYTTDEPEEDEDA